MSNCGQTVDLDRPSQQLLSSYYLQAYTGN